MGFEAEGKQGCLCVMWSRKRRTDFTCRQGVYESPVSHPTADYGAKCHKQWAGRHFTRDLYAVYLAVDWLNWFCCFSDKTVFIEQIRKKLFTCSNSIFKSCWKWASKVGWTVTICLIYFKITLDFFFSGCRADSGLSPVRNVRRRAHIEQSPHSFALKERGLSILDVVEKD